MVAERAPALELWMNYVLRTPNADVQDAPELQNFLLPVTEDDAKAQLFANIFRYSCRTVCFHIIRKLETMHD